MQFTNEKNIAQNTYIYNIVASEKWIEDIGEVTVYGLCVYGYGEGNFNKPIETYAVKDISNNLEEVISLQYLLERNKVSIVHIPDIIDDFLARN